jgi:hypothetical protein
MTIHLISYTHSGLSFLDEITPCFSPVKIYIPWGGTVPGCTDNRDIITVYPPEEYKPEADLNALLGECYGWAYEQGEKSRKEIIKTGHTVPTSNESLRHIKTVLASRISDTSEKDTILRWHMLLHLANRLEENRADANKMIENLKKKPSPLLDNADLTESTRYPLENLRGIDSDSFINDAIVKLLVRAWHGLFNSMIDKGDMLLTFDRHIFDHLSAEWDIYNDIHHLKNPGVVSFKSPLFKRSNIKIEGLTIGIDIRNIVVSDLKLDDKIVTLAKLTAGFESMFKKVTMDSHILFSILLFQAPENPEWVRNYPLLEFLSGRALVFAETHA